MAANVNGVKQSPFKESGTMVCTSPFGVMRSSGRHKGTDIYIKGVTGHLIAFEDGKVIEAVGTASGKSGYGNYVMLEHADGYRTLYAHMKKGSMTVKKGQSVKKGHVLGRENNSGNSSGEHLHFEVRKNNTPIEPMDFIKGSKSISPAAPAKFSAGRYTVNVSSYLHVRKGAGPSHAYLKYSELSSNARAQMAKLTSSRPNGFVKGVKADISKTEGDWGKCPSGWINLTYCTKS